jgi:hypothetical protein
MAAEDLLIAARKLDPKVIETVRDPQFSDTIPADDWRAHIPDSLRTLWGRLGFEARVVAFVVAKEQAEERRGL